MQAHSLKVFVGYDPRFPESYAVTVASIRKHAPNVVVRPIVLSHLQGMGQYTRPTTKDDGKLHDVISDAPMATEFALSRFLVPFLMGFQGHAVFVDGDFLFRDDIRKLARFIRADHAVSVVKHEYTDKKKTKMDGQAQSNYERKNWSSLMLFNCAHPALQYLRPENINTLRGRTLHGLGYLKDEEIGSLPESWNWLDGHSKNAIKPLAVHFTRGTPEMGVKPTAYADEWEAQRKAIYTCET